MARFGYLLLCLGLAGCVAQPPLRATARVDPLLALARVYGVVRYFHPSDSVERVDWNRFLVFATQTMEGASGERETAARLERLFEPIVDGFRIAPEGSPISRPPGNGPAVEWRHLGYGLEPSPHNEIFASWRTYRAPPPGSEASEGYAELREAAEKSVDAEPVLALTVMPGLVAQIPISLPDSAARVGEAQQRRLDRLATTLRELKLPDEPVTRARAAADGIAAWNIARHFYPYWDVVRIDWEGELGKWLAQVPQQQTREELAESLRRLTAPMDDGHVRIIDPKSTIVRRYLPISVRPAGNRWIVDATSIPERIRAGDVVQAIDGKPIDAWYAEQAARVSGSGQFKRWRVRGNFMAGPKDSVVRLVLSRGSDRIEVQVSYDRPSPIAPERPPSIAEIARGIYYVDVTRLTKAALEGSIEMLARARGIVFDLRGIPTSESISIIPYWITGEDTAKWMSLPLFDGPFGRWSREWRTGWNEKRNGALSKPAKVLLTDGRLISHLESLASYFPGQGVGPIVGERTGGANGNSVATTLPSGMQFYLTGMRVTRHDGSLLHREGFRPDIEVVPTAEGLRAGRDEVLDRAVRLLDRGK